MRRYESHNGIMNEVTEFPGAGKWVRFDDANAIIQKLLQSLDEIHGITQRVDTEDIPKPEPKGKSA